MNKRIGLIGMALLLCGVVTSARATNGWGLYGSYLAEPDAFGPGLKITFELVPEVQFDLRVARFSSVDTPAGDVTLVTAEAGMGLNVPLRKPFNLVLGGGPAYHFVDGAGQTDEVGGYLGGCLEFAPYKNAALFFEARYVFLDLDAEDLSGLGLNFGLMVTW